MTRSSIVLLAIAMSAASGCFLFHKQSPQQQYTEALMHGNSMQASQVWIHMSPEARMRFGGGEGFKPDKPTQKDVHKMMMNHDNESSEGGGSAKKKMPPPLGASIGDLPAASGSSSP